MSSKKQFNREKTESVIGDNSELPGWSQIDKFLLLQALEKYDIYDVENISKAVPGKPPQAVTEAIKFYVSKMAQTNRLKNKEMFVKSEKVCPPFGAWAKILSDTVKSEELVGDVSLALRLIADYEDIPKPECTGNVDFKALYALLADVMDGKSIEPNEDQLNLIQKCFVDTELQNKKLIEAGTIKHVLNEINLSKQEPETIPRASQVDELDHLISQKTYNPFNISENHLQLLSSALKHEN